MTTIASHGSVMMTTAPSTSPATAADDVTDKDAGETKEDEGDDNQVGENLDVGRNAGNWAPVSAEDNNDVPHITGEGKRHLR